MRRYREQHDKEEDFSSSQGTTKGRCIHLTSTIMPILQDIPIIGIEGTLDKIDYGAPKSPNILRTIKKGCHDIPQAWSYTINGEEKWFYNFQGGLEEERYIIKYGINAHLPTIEELIFIFANSIHQIIQEERYGLLGFRGVNTGRILKGGELGGLWSRSESSEKKHAHSLIIDIKNTPSVRNNIEFKGIGLPIRFLRKDN